MNEYDRLIENLQQRRLVAVGARRAPAGRPLAYAFGGRKFATEAAVSADVRPLESVVLEAVGDEPILEMISERAARRHAFDERREK